MTMQALNLFSNHVTIIIYFDTHTVTDLVRGNPYKLSRVIWNVPIIL